MKKILALASVAVALLFGTAQAQNISVNAGYMQQTINASTTVGSNTVESDPVNMNGFYVGGMYNYKLQKGLGIEAGLNLEYIFKNDTIAGSLGSIAGGSIENKHTELNISVPVFLNYTLPLGSASLKIYAGPVFSYGISNKTVTTTTVTVLGNSTSNDVTTDFYGDNSDLGKLNVAIAGGVGVDFGQFGVNAGYSYGINDRYPDNDNYKATYSKVFVGLTYNL